MHPIWTRLLGVGERLATLPLRLADAVSNARHAAWNTKVLGSQLAAEAYARGVAGPGAELPPRPTRAGLTSRSCRQADIESAWLRHWCGELRFVPLYHRKVWEDCFVLQALWEAGMLEPGKRGLGFAVGEEWLPSYFARRGINVLATDLDAGDRRARGWIRTSQHGTSVAQLHKPDLVDAEGFARHVSLRAVDMNAIPQDLSGGFDFLWSICSFEHCGSIRRGLDFVVNAMHALKPGGVAVHTTEFKLYPEGRTVERGETVVFQQKHLEALRERLAAAGCEMAPLDLDPGDGLFDRLVDLPPYPGVETALALGDPPHLRLLVKGMVATSVGIIVRKPG